MELTYELCGIKEREELLKVVKHLTKGKEYKLIFSDETSFTKWDAKLYFNNKSYLIEVKIRDTHFDSLILEQHKYDSLMKYKNKFDAILYFNKTPMGYYIARIDNLTQDYLDTNTNTKIANRSSVEKNKGKIKKTWIYLKIGEKMKEIIF